MAGMVRLDEEVQQMLENVRRGEQEAGRPPMSDRAAANWLIRKGYVALGNEPKRKGEKGRP